MKLEENKVYMSVVSLMFNIVTVFVPAIVAVMVAFTFFVRTSGVEGSSMVPTLHDGDRLLITASLPEPKRGDIVVTSQPNALNKTLIKRIIATEGQTVSIDFTAGVVYVDGEALDEPYIAQPTIEREDFWEDVVVEEGKVFVMGDNRNASTDSRSNLVGQIDENYIMGKVIGRIMPTGSFKVE